MKIGAGSRLMQMTDRDPCVSCSFLTVNAWAGRVCVPHPGGSVCKLSSVHRVGGNVVTHAAHGDGCVSAY